MDQKPVPRDPHGDNEMIDAIVDAPAQSGSFGGRLATEVGSEDEEETPLGGQPTATRATKSEKKQPFSETQGGTISD